MSYLAEADSKGHLPHFSHDDSYKVQTKTEMSEK